MLAAAAAGGLLLRWFVRFRTNAPERAEALSGNIQGAAVMIGAVAQVVSIIIKALWGTPAPTPAPIGVRRIGELVGEAA